MALNVRKPTLDPAYLEKLQDYYAEHKVIPSYSVLAHLWGISAKSWVAECVKRFEEAGYLDWTPDRQLKPGARFFARRLAQLSRIDLLAIDDFAIAPITAPERSDLLELLDDRVGARATLITSQLPVTAWHEWLDDPTLADAILDRIVHAAHKITLKGESMRKKQGKP